jgi:hypothetical protein
LRVIARNSSFVYKGRSVDVREAAKQLGVRHILEGSVRKSGNRIRRGAWRGFPATELRVLILPYCRCGCGSVDIGSKAHALNHSRKRRS